MPQISKKQIEQISLAITTGKDVHGVLDMLQGLLDQPEGEPLYKHPAPFTPITADDVTDEMLKAIKKETSMYGVVTTERVVAIYNAVNAYMRAKK